MLLVNKLTEPGAIKKISLYPDVVRVEIRDGKDLTYRLVVEQSCKEAEHEAVQM